MHICMEHSRNEGYRNKSTNCQGKIIKVILVSRKMICARSCARPFLEIQAQSVSLSSRGISLFTAIGHFHKQAENVNATWCTITRVVLVGTPVGCLLAYNSG